MIITMIAAMAENGVIGDGLQMPWKLPADLKLFRRITMGHPLIMGRKTFESIGKPLPGRSTIVLTRQLDDFHIPQGCWKAPSLNDAIQIASQCQGGDEVMIVGGGNVYQQAIHQNLCQRLHLSRVQGNFPGAITFPKDFAKDRDWRVVMETYYPPDQNNEYGFTHFCMEIATSNFLLGRVLTREERENGFQLIK